MLLEFVKGKGNTQKLRLLDNESGQMSSSNTAAVNRASLEFGGIVFDTADNVDYFDWSALDGTLEINIGMAPDLPVGVFQNAELTVYSTDHPDGILWKPLLTVKVY